MFFRAWTLLYFSLGGGPMLGGFRRGIRNFFLTSLLFTSIVSFKTSAHTLMTHQEYLSALRTMDESMTLQSPELIQYSYSVGEWWEVATVRIESKMMRPNNSTLTLQSGQTRLGIFKYQVKEIRSNFPQKLVLEVKQIEHPRTPLIDPRLPSLTLIVKLPFHQTEKIYSNSISVSPNGIRSSFSPLELFDLDVPSIVKTFQNKKDKLPDIPKKLLPFAKKLNLSLEHHRNYWFETTDFFGRPIDLIWRPEDPWPLLQKTPHGFSLLIRKGVQ